MENSENKSDAYYQYRPKKLMLESSSLKQYQVRKGNTVLKEFHNQFAAKKYAMEKGAIVYDKLKRKALTPT